MFWPIASILLWCSVEVLSSSGPTGHLLPFGNHRSPSVVVDEFTKENIPRPSDFYENYVKLGKAALFRGAITDTRAFNLWTDSYIRENFGDNEVRLEAKKEKKHLPPVGEKYIGRDNLRHFVDNYHKEDSNVYIVSDLPRPMYNDVGVLPSVGACGEMGRKIVEVDIWWSGGGSSSIIHKDAFNQINCLVNGTKYWKLIEYKYEGNLYQHVEAQEGYGGFSDVNPSRVDLIQFPKVKDIEWSNVTVNAGDCLFLPKSYYHQVESAGDNNLAVSLLISRFDGRDSLDFSDCTDETDYKTPKTLDNFGVQLVWKGTGTMVMGRNDLEDGYRTEFLQMTEEAEQRNTQLDFEAFAETFNDEDTIMLTGDIQTGFKIIDKNNDGYLTKSEVESLTLEDLQAMSDELEPYEPSNSYDFEYSIISFDLVWRLLNRLKKEVKVLSSNRWEKAYIKEGGTKDKARELFANLAKGKEDIFTHELQPIDMWNALEKWVKYWAPQYSSLPGPPTKKAFGIIDDEDDYVHEYDEL